MCLNVFMVYFNIFIVNTFKCIYSVFQFIYNVFNVFTDIVIVISPPHSHFNVYAMCTYLHICFSLSMMIPFPTCFTSILFFPFPLVRSNFHLKVLYFNSYSSRLYVIPHSTLSLIAWNTIEPRFLIFLLDSMHIS
jgi:hypothetical protein